MARKQVKPRVNIHRNKEGSLISNEQEILNTWVRYFDKLLNRRKDNDCSTLITASSNQISKGNPQNTTDAPTTKEIETALKKLKNYEAPGRDNIPIELLKYGGERLKQWLKHIFSSIWIKEEIPKQRLKGMICPMHKKGDQLECANYRCITLLNVTYKVFSIILYTRLLPHLESKLGHYQVGFHLRKSTINQIFVLTN